MLKHQLGWLVLQLSENKWNGLKNVLQVRGRILFNNLWWGLLTFPRLAASEAIACALEAVK